MDKATLPGEDHPEARTKTIDNLKRIALAMACYARVNNGRFPPAAIRKDGTPLLSWRVAILPFLDVYLGGAFSRRSVSTSPGTVRTTRLFWRRCLPNMSRSILRACRRVGLTIKDSWAPDRSLMARRGP